MVPVELVLRVAYDRKKANEFLDMDKREVAPRIRHDFDILKLPHPPQENIRRPTSDGVTVSWITRVNAPLYNKVTRVVDAQDVDPMIKGAKYRCWIDELFLRELGLSPVPKNWKGDPSPRRRRSTSPPRRRRSTSPPRSPWMTRRDGVTKIENVMQSLRTISDSFTKEEGGHQEVHDSSRRSPSMPRTSRKRPRHAIPAKPMSFEQREDRILELTDELRQTRQEIAQNIDRAARLEKQVAALRSPGEIDEDQDDLHQLARASWELAQERKKREEAEQLLADVRQECSHPMLVPGILKMIETLKLSHTFLPEAQ